MQIRNVGSSNLVIKDVFISANLISSGSITWGAAPNTCPNGNLPVQASCLLSLPSPGGMTSGIAYSVVFVTATGARIGFSATYGHLG